MTYNQDLQRLLHTQMSITFQTLSVLSQSMTLLSAQQSSLSRMFTVINREHQNTNEPPITLSFNAVTLSDLYDSSSNEIPITLNSNDVHPILQNLLNMVNNISDVSSNGTTRNIVGDISQVTEEIRFSDINDPTTTVCPISLEQFEPTDEVLRINRCRHYFKKVLWSIGSL